ncbi:MAG: hypothetical protein KC684_07150 [Candidatus Omnitrophica bacterium]|nr:hypothetical protein [Candidatus Omnitrophota bacterium]
MTKPLDEEIFTEFTKSVKDKNILYDAVLTELNGFITKSKVAEEDWGLLIDKDCFPSKRDENE